MSKDNGGPAFPCTNEQFTLGNPQTGDAWAGLSLRDWFAGQAIGSIISAASAKQHHPGRGASDPRPLEQRIAGDAYEIADAMLAVRKATEGDAP